MPLGDFRLSVLGNNITYMNFAVQPLQWLLEVMIIKIFGYDTIKYIFVCLKIYYGSEKLFSRLSLKE